MRHIGKQADEAKKLPEPLQVVLDEPFPMEARFLFGKCIRYCHQNDIDEADDEKMFADDQRIDQYICQDDADDFFATEHFWIIHLQHMPVERHVDRLQY